MKKEFLVQTHLREEFVDITGKVQEAVRSMQLEEGFCVVYAPHTTCGITINENADPDVVADILTGLKRVVPENVPYAHLEGNSPAHIKASLMGSSALVLVERGRLLLGSWQGIFLAEFDGPRHRKVIVKGVSA
ncbi:MAG: YjbQ family protein [Candidatus Atribacteria bacterium]|nr:YjbQ family protein [Candidatus Atribacteria bacterium]MCD6349440.1 YjbQ family protein [Candidatus Atribacteria bacterium]